MATTKIQRLNENEKIVLATYLEAVNGNRKAQRALRDVATFEKNLTEAITTSDFPGLFAKAINATVENRYTITPAIWDKWAQRYLMNGLRKENFIDLAADFSNLPSENGGVETLPGGIPRIPEGTPFPAIAFTGGEKDVWTYKYGLRLGFTWEAFANDDWNMLGQLPDAMVQRAKRQEDLSATDVLVDADGTSGNGWSEDVFGTYSASGTTFNNKPLNYNNLQTALEQVKKSDDVERVNVITKWALIVPRELSTLAGNLLSAREIEVTDGGSTTLRVDNTIGSSVEVVENPFLTALAGRNGSTFTAQSKMWALVPFGGQGSDRKAIVQTFLRGQEQPELRIKNDTGAALGGGTLDAYAGSFDTDDIQIRLRHFTNTAVMDSTVGFYASRGDGS